MRLRARLDKYYSNEGSRDPLVIDLPKGGYVPTFRRAEAVPDRPGRFAAFVSDGLTAPTMAGPLERRHNLPSQRTSLIGREAVLSAAKQLLLRPDVRLVTFTGPGGTGKTRLALQSAEEVLKHFAGRVYFVPLASITDPGLVAPSIAQTLGMREATGKPLIADLKEQLHDANYPAMLLVLDNFEHLTSAAGIVAELLEASAGIKILATSRALLRVYGEHEFPVAPLLLPDLNLLPDVETLSRTPAIALFLQRAAALKPDFRLTLENRYAVAEICARLDGLPLAIELAAARIKLLPPSAMLARLQSRLELLTRGARDLPERQQTLRATVGWSYELLDPAEQKLFRRLSVFASGCTIEAAEAVGNAPNDLEAEPFDVIASLADKSLLQRSEPPDGEVRFGMLETIREYALERLAASAEEARTRRAHAAFCMVLAEEGGGQLAGSQRRPWINRFDLEQDNFRAALDWLTRTGALEWGMRLGNALHLYWQDHAHPGEGSDRLQALLKLPGASARNKTRARLLFLAGSLCQAVDPDYARVVLREALDINRELGDKVGAAAASTHLAVAYRDGSDYETARTLFTETIRLWQEAGDPVSAAHTMSNLADVVRAEGDYETASKLHEECLSIFHRLGNRAGMAWSLNHQGDVAREQANPTAAALLYEQAVAIFRELGDRTGLARSLADLGNLACDEGRCATAQPLYAEALMLFCELGEAKLCARVLESIACVAVDQKDWERALRVAGTAAGVRQRFRFTLAATAKANLDNRLAPAHQSLSGESAAIAWMEGYSMPLEKAIEYALGGNTK